MNAPLIHDDFLLTTPWARRLYHEVAAPLSIVDFHCHLDATVLAANLPSENLAQLWVTTDPYKHRAMRMAGVPERLITGEAPDFEKFQAWASVCPETLGGPLFHWSALELKRVFGVEVLLSPETAAGVWEVANAHLATSEGRPQALLRRAKVVSVGTSNSLDEDLGAHRQLASERASAGGYSGSGDADFPAVRVIPTLRDAAVVEVLRFDEFSALGCCLADHGVAGSADLEALLPLAREYARRGWVLQLHLGAQRQTSSRLRRLVGPAGGYATIGNAVEVTALCRFLDTLESEGLLPRTILFPLNPGDYAALATLTGSFAEDGVPGKVQLGPAWWFNDHAWGIRHHLELLANYGLLATFIGMTTDSRSLLSTVRHEYFRRHLCAWLGEQVAGGTFPADFPLLARLVSRLCYDNAAAYLPGFGR